MSHADASRQEAAKTSEHRGPPAPELTKPAPDGYSIDARPNAIVGRLAEEALLGTALGQHPRIELVHASGQKATAFVAMNGFFARGALEDGSWTVRCTAPGFRVDPRVVELGPAHPRADVELTATRLPRLQLTVRTSFTTPPQPGRVLPREAWLSAAAIVATLGAPGDFLTELPANARPLAAFLPRSTDEVAGSERTLMLDGALPFTIEGDAWISFVVDRRVVASKPIEGAGKTLAFDLGEAELARVLGTLVVRAVDAERGLPLRSAFLEMLGAPEHGGVRVGLPGDAAFSESARIDHVLTGPLALAVRAQGFERKLVVVDVRPGETVALDARLGPETHVRGRLVDSNGAPVEAGVELSPLEEPEPLLAEGSTLGLSTRADGTFSFAELPAAAWVLHPYGDRATFAPIVVDTRGETSDLVVTTARGTRVCVDVPSRSREDAVTGSLRIVDARGLVVLERFDRQFSGTFEGALLPGRYRARYTDSQGRTSEREFDVGSTRAVVRFE